MGKTEKKSMKNNGEKQWENGKKTKKQQRKIMWEIIGKIRRKIMGNIIGK